MYVSIRSTHSYNIRKKSLHLFRPVLIRYAFANCRHNFSKHKEWNKIQIYDSHKGCSKRKGYPKKSPHIRTVFDSLMSYFSATKKKGNCRFQVIIYVISSPLFCSRLYWRIVHNWVKFILEHPTAINISFNLCLLIKIVFKNREDEYFNDGI